MRVSSPYFDPEFYRLQERIYGPKVSIDNDSMRDCTVIKVDGINKQGLLLEVVQVLTDVNLSISKSYISADGRWFMDVFHVKDEKGNKLTDQSVIEYIQQAIGSTSLDGLNLPDWTKTRSHTIEFPRSEKPNCDHTMIEMTGADRPGLLSEISAALSGLRCRIIDAHAWTQNSLLACVAHVSDQHTDDQINDPSRLAAINDRLTSILKARTISSFSEIPMVTAQEANTPESDLHPSRVEWSVTDLERRLHQLMLSARDFDESYSLSSPNLISEKKHVSVEDCDEKGYLIVSIKCNDSPRLMFDCVCTLTDMQYEIYHASGRSCDGYAFQEFFIRHVNGSTLNTDSEKERIVKCMEAAIGRRVSKGVRVELCAKDREGLLSDMTRALHENGLDVVQALVATQGDESVHSFYVRGISGNPVRDMDVGFVESLKKEMGPMKVAFQ
ncbi:ACT domain-containing protein ACR2-like [Punica granatum]|uniref:ACT domain-containing protein ACR n=1 Tax=Punica granatum TaxID=22663 RepID=A0A6P8E9R8_PUNGR|nr:ACT domain-containing protein ACR2-like [Punica granatum]